MHNCDYINYTTEEGKKERYLAVRLEAGLFNVLKREAQNKGMHLSSFIREELRQKLGEV